MKIGVVGVNGNLGKSLVEMGCSGLECDLTNPESISDAISKVRPDIVINTAGKTNVDWCEKHEVEAIKTNLRGVANLLQVCFVPVIHLSTGYVYSGKHGPYDEKYRKDFPIQAYGWSKVGGEAVILGSNRAGDSIVRTVGLYGGHKDDFAKMVISSLQQGISLDIAKDIKFNPTYIPHLCEALIALADLKKRPQIINLAGDTVLSRYSFALLIAEMFNLENVLLNPVNGCDAWVAQRPKNSGLKVTLAKNLGLPIYSVVQGLEALKEGMYA